MGDAPKACDAVVQSSKKAVLHRVACLAVAWSDCGMDAGFTPKCSISGIGQLDHKFLECLLWECSYGTCNLSKTLLD